MGKFKELFGAQVFLAILLSGVCDNVSLAADAARSIQISDDMLVVTIENIGYFVHDISQTQKQIDGFNVRIKQKASGKEITNCSTIINVSVGGKQGNTSYGGICSSNVDKDKVVAICYDEMVGHFKISPATKGFSKRDLINFLAVNCWGG